jgi:hypothetical protein
MRAEKSNKQLFREYHSLVYRYYSMMARHEGDIETTMMNIEEKEQEILSRMISPKTIKLEIK